MMKGHLSFVLASLACAVLLSCYLGLRLAPSVDLSKAIAAERAYGVEMDAKGAAAECIRQGMLESFSHYDLSHDAGSCSSCPGACGPPPSSPCDVERCGSCFREDEARIEAERGAQGMLGSLRGHSFDPAFVISLSQADIEVFLEPDPGAKNGFSAGFARLRDPIVVSVSSESLGIQAESEIPAGWAIR